MKKNYLNLMAKIIMAIVCVSFVSCGGSDDNDENASISTPWGGVISAPIEGIWYLKSEHWMWYVKGGEIFKKETDKERIYDDYSNNEVMTITKSGEKYAITTVEYSKYGYITGGKVYYQIGNYEFENYSGGEKHRFVIISADEKTLKAECYEDYGKNVEGEVDEYGILIYMR